jgi:hypothetical protein
MKAYWESGGIPPRILRPQQYVEVSGQLHAPAVLPPGKDPPPSGTHCIGGWVGPRAVLDAVVKREIGCGFVIM